MNKLESFKLITLEEFKNWEGFDKLVSQYEKKLYDDNISNYLIEGTVRASLQLDSVCGYRLETEFPLLDPNSEIDKKSINYVKIACCLQTQYLIRTGIEYSTGGENSSDGVASYTYPTNMKTEFSPDVISLLEKAKFYKSQTIIKINPDNYGFKNEYHTWFGRSDTDHKDRPIMLSEADAKYVWKNSIFKSNTLSIIPWYDTEKSGTLQIEISRELLVEYIDNYIKNVSIKVDDKSVVYNSNNELSVPFDNDTIYGENGVWKSKQRGQSQNLHIVIGESGRANDDYDKQTGGLRVWDPSFDGNKMVADYSIIDIAVAGIESTDDTFGTTKYIDKFYLQKKDLPKIPNKWEIVNTSDFIKNSKEYTVRAFNDKYYYRINCFVETKFRLYGFTIFVNPKFISEKVPTTHYIGTSIEDYSSIFEWNKNTNYGTVTIEKAESAQYLNEIYIERKIINN